MVQILYNLHFWNQHDESFRMIPILLDFEHFLIFDLPFIYRFLTIMFECSGSRVVRALGLGLGSNPSAALREAEDNVAWFGVPHQGFSLSSPASRAALKLQVLVVVGLSIPLISAAISVTGAELEGRCESETS